VQAVFLDRDGVINENRCDHVTCWDEFRFIPGARDAIARLTGAGVRVFVVTNQAIVNRGVVTPQEISAINERMVAEIVRAGGRVEAVAWCPHRPDEGCACRKPKPGLLLALARRYALDLHDTVLVGDALSDVQAGQAAGCSTVLVLTGRGRGELARASAAGARGFAVASDLSTAVDQLLRTAVAAA
jgi:D-glycero-D-manno-heptose 1,7-bisphosphate phosphatase